MPLAVPLLATPNTGTGVYNGCLPNEGGQVTGDEKNYKVWVTRTSGAGGTSSTASAGSAMTERSAPGRLPLQNGKAAARSSPRPRPPGVHSAIMTIDDPATAGIDQFVPVTVLATSPGAPGPR